MTVHRSFEFPRFRHLFFQGRRATALHEVLLVAVPSGLGLVLDTAFAPVFIEVLTVDKFACITALLTTMELAVGIATHAALLLASNEIASSLDLKGPRLTDVPVLSKTSMYQLRPLNEIVHSEIAESSSKAISS